jgi:hypothetical protein
MISVRSITFGEVVSISFADTEQLRDFAMVHQTLVLEPSRADPELLEAAESAIKALLEDVLEDIALSEPLQRTPVQTESDDDDDDE